MALALSSTETRVSAVASTDQIRMTGDGANLWRVERRGSAMNLVWYQNNVFRSNRPLTGITITASDKIVSVCNENASNLLVAIYFTTGTPRTEIWRVPKATSGTAVATRLSTAVQCSRRTEVGTDFDGNKWVSNHRGIFKRVDNITTSSPTACNFNNTIGGNTFSATALPVGAAEVVDGSDDKMLILRQDGNLYEVTPNTTTSGTTITATLVGNIGTGTPEGLAATDVNNTTKNLYYTRGNVLYRRALTHAAEPTGPPPAQAGSFTAGVGTLRLAVGAGGSTNIGAASGGTGTVSYTQRTAQAGIFLSGRTLGVAGTVPAGTYRLTIRATWTSGTTTAFRDSVYVLTVQRVVITQRGTFSVAGKSLTLQTGTAGSFNFESATGGAGTLTYSLVSPPAGFSLSGQTISVANTVAAGRHSLRVRATWQGDVGNAQSRDATFTFTLTRQAQPVFTGSGGTPLYVLHAARKRRKRLLDDDY